MSCHGGRSTGRLPPASGVACYTFHSCLGNRCRCWERSCQPLRGLSGHTRRSKAAPVRLRGPRQLRIPSPATHAGQRDSRGTHPSGTGSSPPGREGFTLPTHAGSQDLLQPPPTCTNLGHAGTGFAVAVGTEGPPRRSGLTRRFKARSLAAHRWEHRPGERPRAAAAACGPLRHRPRFSHRTLTKGVLQLPEMLPGGRGAGAGGAGEGPVGAGPPLPPPLPLRGNAFPPGREDGAGRSLGTGGGRVAPCGTRACPLPVTTKLRKKQTPK